MVRVNTTAVEFLPKGVTIADATGAAAASPAPTPPLQAPAAAAPAIDPAANVAPEAPLDYTDPLAAKRAPAEPVYENTSEDEADAQLPPADPLSDALTGALPDGFVVPPVGQQP